MTIGTNVIDSRPIVTIANTVYRENIPASPPKVIRPLYSTNNKRYWVIGSVHKPESITYTMTRSTNISWNIFQLRFTMTIDWKKQIKPCFSLHVVFCRVQQRSMRFFLYCDFVVLLFLQRTRHTYTHWRGPFWTGEGAGTYIWPTLAADSFVSIHESSPSHVCRTLGENASRNLCKVTNITHVRIRTISGDKQTVRLSS